MEHNNQGPTHISIVIITTSQYVYIYTYGVVVLCMHAYAVYSALGRSGLILISFSTVSCCPLQFSAVCIYEVQYLNFIWFIFLALYLHAICVSV